MMNRMTMMVLAFASLAGCALQEDEKTADDGGSTTVVVTETKAAPAPFKSPAPYVLDFNAYYVNSSPCGALIGTLHGTDWGLDWDRADSIALKDADVVTGEMDGWLGTSIDGVVAGSYRIAVMDTECPGEVEQWAVPSYGNPEVIKEMKPEDRAFLDCHWYDSVAKCRLTNSSNPTCDLAVTYDAQGNISADGNMADFTGTEPTCQ